MEIKEEVKKIFEENNWSSSSISHVSVEFDENKKLKAIINYDKEMFILKNVWVREDLRGTGYTQDFLRRVFKEYTFMFVWEPNISFIKAMVKAGLGLHKKVQRMDVWCLIPQMLSDVSNGFISRHDYLIKKNKHYYTMGTAPDKEGILVNPLSKEVHTKEEYELILKDKEIITKKWRLIWNRCNKGLRLTVQEFNKDSTTFEKNGYTEKLERSKSFLSKYLKKTLKEYEEMKGDMTFIET
ncbi:MAG: hypothetical protein K8E24_005575 [Methanobacterium paludis]|nr:hypothetical protein [Methanobacterium paludis]